MSRLLKSHLSMYYNKNKMCLLFVLLTILCGLLQHGLCQLEGEACEAPTGAVGVCKPASECPRALKELRQGIRPQVCGFRGKETDVCCLPAVPAGATSTQGSALPDYEDYGLVNGTECGPVPTQAARVLKSGQKAWDKCIEYLKYVYPCEFAETLSARKDKARRYRCGHEDAGLSEGTRKVGDREIPHMALLGYGPSVDSATWACAGTVISENYVLTAARCISSKESEMVRFVRVGLVSISPTIDPDRVHRVSKFISSPRYNRLLSHYDIGLVLTATRIIFDDRVYPACLHTGNPVDDDKVMATGWGLVNFGGIPGSLLNKVTLDKHGMEDCEGRRRRLPKNQLCAGYPADVNGTCQVDPGSPLQILNHDVDCMYTVLAVASAGPKCDARTEHGVFTRVSIFVRWIEGIVWP